MNYEFSQDNKKLTELLAKTFTPPNWDLYSLFCYKKDDVLPT